MPEAVSPPQRIPPPVEVHVPQQQEQVVNAHCSQSPVKHSAVMNGGGSGHGGGPGPEVQPVVKQEKTESDAPAPTSTEDRKQSDTPVPAICPTGEFLELLTVYRRNSAVIHVLTVGHLVTSLFPKTCFDHMYNIGSL